MAQAAWIWWLGGGVLALAGLWLLWWSLFRDRARGRRRCPRCWYDMSGVPGLVCPECGGDARREKRLGSTRRRWGVATAGLALLALAIGCGAFPRYRALGALSFVPTDLLLLLLPPDDEAVVWDDQLADYTVHPVAAEVTRRIESGAMSSAQWGRLMQRPGLLGARSHWPRSAVTLDVHVRLPWWADVEYRPAPGRRTMRHLQFKFHADGDVDGAEEVSTIEYGPNATLPLRLPLNQGGRSAFRVGGVLYVDSGDSDRSPEVLWSGDLGPSIEFADAIGSCMQAVRDAELTRVVETGLWPRVLGMERQPGRWHAWILVSFKGEPAEPVESVAIGVRVEVVQDGQVVETVRGPLLDGPAEFRDFEQRSLDAGFSPSISRLLAQRPSEAELARWTIRLKSDVEAALMDVARPLYWEGELEFPLSEVLEADGG